MYNRWVKILYNASSLSPVILILIILNYKSPLPYLFGFVFVVSLILLFHLLFKCPQKIFRQDTIEITDISLDNDYYKSLIAYSIPLITAIFSNDPIIVITITFIEFLSFYMSDISMPNLLLAILGYKQYKVKIKNGLNNVILISDMEYLKNNFTIKGYNLFPNMILGVQHE